MPSSAFRLILFDIDGTLISTGGRAGRALLRALRDTYGVDPQVDGYSFSGKTDPQIVRELLTASGVPAATIEEHRSRALARYLEYLEKELPPGSVQLLPGVQAVLDALAVTPGVCLGLLTGNIARGAALKLRAAGLDGFFGFGAFGSDAEDRNLLVPIARERARRATGLQFAEADTVVVGDAEADIRCARAGRARAVAVATGWTPRQVLAALKPDVVLDSLAAPDALAAILGDGHPPQAPYSSRL
ncbi:MAG: HAD hydrolase-like protein [Acidobacteriota bacterium]|jgi:phosphoglycolate phosphatase-like HAD superfamily hydrolase